MFPVLSKPKNPKVAALLALSSCLVPLPVAGFHKFYLGQIGWGIVYVLFGWTQIPRVASALEGLWYLLQSESDFNRNFNGELALPVATSTPFQPTVDPKQVGAIAEAVRELDRLRQEGLISEYEFEQKRRQLLDQIS